MAPICRFTRSPRRLRMKPRGDLIARNKVCRTVGKMNKARPSRVLLLVALPEHLEKVLAKEVKDVRIDTLGDTAIAFFISHSSVKLRARPGLHEPTFRVSMIFQRTPAGWRAIHFHESSLSAQAAQAMASA